MAAQTVTKVQYENNVTVIGAANLNAIQDAVNNHAGLIDDLGSDKVDKVEGKGLSTNDFNNEAQSKLNNLPTGEQLDTSLGQKVGKRTSGTEVYTHTGSTQGGATLTETPTAGAVPMYGTGGVLKAAAPVADNDVVRKAELDGVKDNLDAAFVVNTASGAIASFPDGADGVPMKSLVVNIEPVQEGTGDPSPDNIRPISGWTGMTGKRTGKNLLQNTGTSRTHNGVTFTINEDGTVTANGTATGGNAFVTVNSSEAVLPSACLLSGCTGGSAQIYRLRISDASGAQTVLYSNYNGDTELPAGTVLTQVMVYVTEGSTVSNVVFKPMLRPVSDTDDTYEPYTGTDITADWSSVAGTVYGGTLTINPDRTGTLVVDRAIVDLGTLNWTTASGCFLSSGISPAGPPSNPGGRNPVICSKYKTKATRAYSDAYQNLECGISVGGNQILIKDSAYSDTATFKTAMSGVQFVYELATPVTYTLTATEISAILTTLYGTNNVWADCGDTEVTYCADTKLYIQQLTQPTEDDMTANANIAANTFFTLGNTLYFSTAAISAGEAIVPGTNCSLVSLADALNQLNA